MPFYERGDVRIRYEETAGGYPLLVIPGGGGEFPRSPVLAITAGSVGWRMDPDSARDGLSGDGKHHQFGANPTGMMILDAGGNYTQILVNPDLPKYKSNDRTKASPAELAASVAAWPILALGLSMKLRRP